MRKIPRDYQEAAHTALWNYVHQHPDKNPLVLMPTGVGKSLQMAMFIWAILAKYPFTRILQVTHSKELIRGNYDTLMEFWPGAPAGIYSAGLKRRDISQQVTFCGIMSVAKKAPLFKRVDFMIIDEAHMVSDKANASYVKFIKELRNVNPNLIVIGFTATGYRMGMGSLLDGGLFDETAYDLSSGEAFVELIENGYLSPLHPINPGFYLDSENIKLTGGDFNSKETSEAMRDQNLLERAVDTTVRVAREEGRKSCLIFAQSIDDSELLAEMFTDKGFPVEAVHSKTKDRDDVLRRLRSGELWGVTNMGVLTTGFDHAPIDLLVLLRLTRSTALHVQIIGRGTRPVFADGFDLQTKEGRLAAIAAGPKQDCKVLDFVGNTERLGPINAPALPKRRGSKKGSPPARTCPTCSYIQHISKPICGMCGHEFPPPERLKEKASTAKLVALNTKPPEPEFIIQTVHEMVASVNEGRNGKRDTVKVGYRSGFNYHYTWICVEHPPKSYPRIKAEQWWKLHGGQGELPTTCAEVVEAIAGIQKPVFIKVRVDTRYQEIAAYDMNGTGFELPPELGGPPPPIPEVDPLATATPVYRASPMDYEDIPF